MSDDGHAITFDFHDTLAHCEPWFDLEVRSLASAWLRWRGAKRGSPATDATLSAADAAYRRLREAIVGHGSEETAERCVAVVLAEIGEPVDGTSIEAGVAHLMREAFAAVEPIPGSIETVRALAATGVPLGVVSSAVYHPFLEWTLTSFGIRDAFADVTTSASAGFYKSRPQIYWHALDRIGACPGRAVHVGDSWRWDVAMGREAGLRTAWLRKPGAQSGEGPTPDLTLDSLHGAAPLLLALLDGDAGDRR